MDRGSGVYYYIYDGLGSTRQLVNTSGTVTDTWNYSAFGELASHTGTTANPFLFNAQQFDGASGDYYLRARYYDQSSGRFVSQDPYSGSNEDPPSLHRYLYTSCDPLNRVDPGGQSETLVSVGLATTISLSLGAISAAGVIGLRGTALDAVFGFEFGALAAASTIEGINIGKAPQTIVSGIIGGAISLIVAYYVHDKGKPTNDAKLLLAFLKGYAVSAYSTAFSKDDLKDKILFKAGLTFVADLFAYAQKDIEEGKYDHIVEQLLYTGGDVGITILTEFLKSKVDIDNISPLKNLTDAQYQKIIVDILSKSLSGVFKGFYKKYLKGEQPGTI